MKYSSLKCQVTTGVILIFLGITLLLTNYISDKREEIFSSMNLELSNEMLEDDSLENDTGNEREESVDTEQDIEKTNIVDYESYAGILEINKIGLYKGFYAKESSLNNVKFNLKILDVSSYPDEEAGNVIIIGHSGNYSNSYFANLYQLQVGDMASVYYNNQKYNYSIVNIYNEDKDGTVTIYRNQEKNTMTLITCTKDDETKQTVYILELVNIE